MGNACQGIIGTTSPGPLTHDGFSYNFMQIGKADKETMAKATRYTDELIKEYRQKGFWEDTRLCDLWDRNARDFPDRIALSDSSHCLTYSEANLWIDRLALGL